MASVRQVSYEEFAAFLERVRGTIDWYYDPNGAGQRFRSPYTAPRGLISDVRGHTHDETYAVYKQLVEETVAKRSQPRAFTRSGPHHRDRSLADWVRDRHNDPYLAGGGLVAYDPNQNLADGAAERASGGFFDVANEPGWDTWVMYVVEGKDEKDRYRSIWGAYLVAWVPNDWVQRVEDGISVNPEECIRWFDELDTPLAEAICASDVMIPRVPN